MGYDERWDAIAREWLSDSGLPEDAVARYTTRLAQRLQDHAEDFVAFDVPDMEHEREEAAYDAHVHRQIDEARGK